MESWDCRLRMSFRFADHVSAPGPGFRNRSRFIPAPAMKTRTKSQVQLLEQLRMVIASVPARAGACLKDTSTCISTPRQSTSTHHNFSSPAERNCFTSWWSVNVSSDTSCLSAEPLWGLHGINDVIDRPTGIYPWSMSRASLCLVLRPNFHTWYSWIACAGDSEPQALVYP